MAYRKSDRLPAATQARRANTDHPVRAQLTHLSPSRMVDHIGRSARGYPVGFASLAAWSTQRTISLAVCLWSATLGMNVRS